MFFPQPQPAKKRQAGVIQFQGFPSGLNTAVPEEMLLPTELSACKDLKINKGGQLETRGAIVKHTTVACSGSVKAVDYAILGGTGRTLICDDDDKIYYLSGTVSTLIGTAEGEASFIPYNDVCLICDGSYLKYVDDVSGLKLAYDAGTDGTQYNNYAGNADTIIKIGDDTNTRAAVKFTTETWTSGYTIPLTQVDVFLSSTGSPTGDITCRLRLVSDDSILASTVLDEDASEIASAGEFITANFLTVITEMSPATDYYCSFEHTGDDSNYVSLNTTTVASGGVGYHYSTTEYAPTSGSTIAFVDGGSGVADSITDTASGFLMAGLVSGDTITVGGNVTTSGNAKAYVTTSITANTMTLQADTITAGEAGIDGVTFTNQAKWISDPTHDPIVKVYPGKPPKASFGCVHNVRPFLSGDPDNPGYVWFGNLTHLDWSTTNYAGFIGVIDDNRNSFEVGGLDTIYGQLWVYGTESQPFLCQLTGSEPADYSLPLAFQKAWCKHKTIINTGNDLWVASGDGIDTLSGVQEYGDVRTFSASDKIKNRIDSSWGDNTFVGYYPPDGQFWIKLDGYEKVLIGHTKIPNNGLYPWAEYDLPITPTAFGYAENFYIGADDGHLYKFDSGAYKDLTTDDINPEWSTANIELPFQSFDLDQFQVLGRALTGSSMDIDIYKDGNRASSVYTYSFNMPMSDSLRIEEMTMAIEEMTTLPRPDLNPLWKYINIECRSFKIKFSNIKISGEPVYFNGMFMRYRQLEQ